MKPCGGSKETEQPFNFPRTSRWQLSELVGLVNLDLEVFLRNMSQITIHFEKNDTVC
jgi:hypothetical protein